MIKIITPNNSVATIEIDGIPTTKQLADWLGVHHIEYVRVFYNGKYELMVVHDEGALQKDRVENKMATMIYHENARLHRPELLENAPNIYGTAILLTGYNKPGGF